MKYSKVMYLTITGKISAACGEACWKGFFGLMQFTADVSFFSSMAVFCWCSQEFAHLAQFSLQCAISLYYHSLVSISLKHHRWSWKVLCAQLHVDIYFVIKPLTNDSEHLNLIHFGAQRPLILYMMQRAKYARMCRGKKKQINAFLWAIW